MNRDEEAIIMQENTNRDPLTAVTFGDKYKFSHADLYPSSVPTA